MNGKFSERTTPLMISAMRSACSSLSITHGPAMRNRSPEPTRTLSIWKDKVKSNTAEARERRESFQVSSVSVSSFFGLVIASEARDLHVAAKCRPVAELGITTYENCHSCNVQHNLATAAKSPLAPDQDRQEYHRRPRYPQRCGPCRQ